MLVSIVKLQLHHHKASIIALYTIITLQLKMLKLSFVGINDTRSTNPTIINQVLTFNKRIVLKF
jgi:hypothetical protein